MNTDDPNQLDSLADLDVIAERRAKESGKLSAEKIAESIVVTAGERPLYSAGPVEELARGHLALVAERDALREAVKRAYLSENWPDCRLILKAALERHP